MKPSDRLVTIHKVLFEMARGRFHVQIPISTEEDEYDTLAVLINMVAEEMRESLFHSGYINTGQGAYCFTLLTLGVSPALTIESCNRDGAEFLGYDVQEITGKNLSEILVDDTLIRNFISLKGNDQSIHDQHLPLILLNKNELRVPLQCYLSYMSSTGKYVLNAIISRTQAIDLIREEAPAASDQDNIYKLKRSDTLKVQQLHEYIMQHYKEPLPSIKNLAKRFGTNECKLKETFRKAVGTSIYQCYHEKRLQEARLSIQHSNLTLKQIAFDNGFSNYPNFSKAFKKYFGIAPNEVPRDFKHS